MVMGTGAGLLRQRVLPMEGQIVHQTDHLLQHVLPMDLLHLTVNLHQTFQTGQIQEPVTEAVAGDLAGAEVMAEAEVAVVWAEAGAEAEEDENRVFLIYDGEGCWVVLFNQPLTEVILPVF